MSILPMLCVRGKLGTPIELSGHKTSGRNSYKYGFGISVPIILLESNSFMKIIYFSCWGNSINAKICHDHHVTMSCRVE